MTKNKHTRILHQLDRLHCWYNRITYCERFGHHPAGNHCLNCGVSLYKERRKAP